MVYSLSAGSNGSINTVSTRAPPIIMFCDAPNDGIPCESYSMRIIRITLEKAAMATNFPVLQTATLYPIILVFSHGPKLFV
ncbi:hypothetical protein OGATHE_005200 [Ogataea polymorpha]|uniref:Uncharacterized protein n=1 Tax=Ogataea polymorpha TaxID=460523 RepID=A0A9P8NVY2_9ASCO|nr:hypothetical protein OGATHE_005200 [Ogataea polymorpha]